MGQTSKLEIFVPPTSFTGLPYQFFLPKLGFPTLVIHEPILHDTEIQPMLNRIIARSSQMKV